jgi:RNA polymerase sigma-70 factor (ECF subfamily)
MQQDERLSQIQTIWTSMFSVARNIEDQSTHRGKSLRELVLRYYGSVYRYILGMVRDPEMAMELTQEFASRFLRGDYMKADPTRGRFRDFLKVSVRNLVMDYFRRKQVEKVKGPGPLDSDAAEPNDPQKANDEAFVSSFREEVLARTWEALAEAEKTSGKPFYTVLRFKIQHSEMNSTEMAEKLSVQLGKPLSDVNARKILQRARSDFADLLLDEVGRTLENPSTEELARELADLRLLDYCKSALERRTKQASGEA